MLIRDIVAETKTAVVSFTRMQPPTRGHKVLVNKIKEHRGDHYLFLSHTTDTKKNPLTYESKKYFVEQSFPDIEIGDSSVKNPFDMMKFLENQGYQKVIVVVGSDRVAKFDKMFQDYNGKDFQFESIKVVNAGDRDPDSDDVAGLSASKLRESVINNDYATFVKGLANENIGEELFQTIKETYGMTESASAGGTSAGGIASTGNGFANGGPGTLMRVGTVNKKKSKKKKA